MTLHTGRPPSSLPPPGPGVRPHSQRSLQLPGIFFPNGHQQLWHWCRRRFLIPVFLPKPDDAKNLHLLPLVGVLSLFLSLCLHLYTLFLLFFPMAALVNTSDSSWVKDCCSALAASLDDMLTQWLSEVDRGGVAICTDFYRESALSYYIILHWFDIKIT